MVPSHSGYGYFIVLQFMTASQQNNICILRKINEITDIYDTYQQS